MGKTLAIEHTLVEPFEGDRAELDRLLRVRFLAIEEDPALVHADRIAYVDIPTGPLPNGSDWQEVARSVHRWLRANLAAIPDDTNDRFECAVGGRCSVDRETCHSAEGRICETHPDLPWPHEDCAGPSTQRANPSCHGRAGPRPAALQPFDPPRPH